MGFTQGNSLAGWSGDISQYFFQDGATPFSSNNMNVKHLRWIATLNQLATTPYRGSGKPNANNDSVDTDSEGRPFRKGALWIDENTDNMWQCTGHAEGAATWTLITGVAAEASSSSSSLSTTSESSSSQSTTSVSSPSSSISSSSSTQAENTSSSSSSSTVAGNTSSSSSTIASNTSSSSDSTLSDSSQSSSSSSLGLSSSSSTVAGVTSSSSSSP